MLSFNLVFTANSLTFYIYSLGAVTAVNEIQQLNCRADNGSFMLSFRENVTLPIDWNSTVAEFQHRLEQLFT